MSDKKPETKVEFDYITYDGDEVLQKALAKVGEYEHVIVLATRRDGGRELIHSTMGMRDKTMLLAFFTSYINNWFRGAEVLETKENLNGETWEDDDGD